jgi:hypothetical protein
MEKSSQNPTNPGRATMRNITVAFSDDSYRQSRIRVAVNDTSVSAAVQDLLLSPGSRRNVPTLPPTHPLRADIEIKNSASFLGCDPVKLNRTIGESAV